MFFLLSKTLDLFLDPLCWALVLITIGVVLFARGARRRASLALVVLGLLILVSFSLPAVALRLAHSLESEVPSSYRADVTYDVVVLLGGTVDPSGATADQVAWNSNVDRLTVVYDLLRTGHARSVIVSGGELGKGLPTEAAYLARQLEAWGIERSRIVLDEKAKNTRENATESERLVREGGFKTVLMVTSAFHMPRALGCFRAVGLAVDTLPVDFRVRRVENAQLPRTGALNESASALREYAGRLVYRLMGYTK